MSAFPQREADFNKRASSRLLDFFIRAGLLPARHRSRHDIQLDSLTGLLLVGLPVGLMAIVAGAFGRAAFASNKLVAVGATRNRAVRHRAKAEFSPNATATARA